MYSLAADIISFIMLLVAAFIGLWNGKSLEEVSGWRQSLEQAATSGTALVYDEWVRRGLPQPLDLDKILTELGRVRTQEKNIRKRRKITIIILIVVGAVFFFFAKYFSALGV